MPVSRVFVSSRIPGILQDLEAKMPHITFQPIEPEHLAKEDSTKDWKNEILVADNNVIGHLLYRPKGQIAFIQVCKGRST